MAYNEAQRKAAAKYRTSGKSLQVVITMKAEDKRRWDSYARWKGRPLATLIRELVAKEMRLDNYIGEKEEST